MRKTIDDSRKRKRRIIWLASSMLGLLLGFGIYEYVTVKNTPERVVQVNSKVLQTLASSPNNTEKGNLTTREVALPAAKNEKENIKETTHTSNQTASVASDKILSQHTIPSVDQKSVKTESVGGNVNYIASTKPPKQLSADHNKDHTRRSSEAQLDKISSANSEATMNLVASSSLPAKNSDNASKKEAVTQVSASPAVISGTHNISRKPDSTAKSQNVAEETNSSLVKSSSNELNKKADSNTKKQTVAEVTKNTAAAASKSDSSNKKTDSIPPPKAASEMVSPLPPIEGKVPSKNSFTIEAGAGYSLGWNYSDTVQGRGINPIIGIGYTRILSPKFALKTGIQVSSLSGMGTSPFIIKHVNYDFGYNSNDTSLKTNWLFYLTLPLQVEYKLDEKDAIGLGGTLSYLITGYGQVSSSTFTGDVSKTTNTYSQYMYVKGFNQWNASVFLLYKRTLFGKLSAYIIPYFGLMDVKSNSFFSQNKFERDSGLKLLLSYTIF
ncbi:MAG TPA: hypothetical protein VNZ45_18685 [Bacteroidia bacterium]|nr:hypothetical protein [Bacteroidia bacterium]